MADIAEAATQDEIAESLVTDSAAESTSTESTGAEEVEQVEEQQQVETEQEESQEDADYLPTEQEKVFPDEVLLRYAQRYNRDEQWLSDPLNRQLIIDKINSDIFLRQQSQNVEQPELEEDTEALEPTQQQQQLPSREEYFKNLDAFVQQRTDPEVAKMFHADFLRAFGVPEAEIQKIPAQQAQQFTQTVSRYMANFLNTFIPPLFQGGMLGNLIEQQYPEFGEMYGRAMYAHAWDKVRATSTDYKSLPNYGTKEFAETLYTAAAKIPGFDEMQFTGKNGQPLSPLANAQRKYSLLAQIATGQQVNLETVNKAVEKGKEQQRRAGIKREAGKLGAGQSKSNFASGAGDEDFFSNMSDWWKENGDTRTL